MAQLDVVGLGVSTVDIVVLVDHFPAQEEVQRAVQMTVQGGGPVATAVVALARLGARVAMIDAIGSDWRGALIREEFMREGVLTDYVRVMEGCTSSLACVLVRKDDAARSIVYSPGTAPELSPADVPRSAIESSKFLHVNGRHWDACLEAVKWARDAGIQVSFDGGAHRYRPEMSDLVPLTDVCIVARSFAEEYTQQENLRSAAEALLQQGPRLVVLTDGARGSWIYPRCGSAFHQPAYTHPDVVDTTGCGDSYHGGFLFGLCRGLGLEQTASIASAVASLNSRHLGGRTGLPTLEDVELFLSAV